MEELENLIKRFRISVERMGLKLIEVDKLELKTLILNNKTERILVINRR